MRTETEGKELIVLVCHDLPDNVREVFLFVKYVPLFTIYLTLIGNAGSGKVG